MFLLFTAGQQLGGQHLGGQHLGGQHLGGIGGGGILPHYTPFGYGTGTYNYCYVSIRTKIIKRSISSSKKS